MLATLASVLLAKSFGRYPGIEAAAYVTSSYFACYGTVFSVLLMGRLDYSRPVLLIDFFVTLAWSIIAEAYSAKRALRVGVVPEGNCASLFKTPPITCVALDREALDYRQFDVVAADLQHDLSSEWERFLADCALKGIPVYHTKHLMESLTGKVELERLSENSFGMLAPVSAFMTIKHVVDWLAALLALIILLPALCFIALLIRLDSRGPAIFRQRRIGYQGRPFTVYKFRTMALEQEGVDARQAAKTESGDQRITRLGAVLRPLRIDELPQILNILKAEMSWIGPRPEAMILSKWYEEEIPFYRYRHIVRPGLTGWAQVNQGHVAEVSDVQHKLYYDFYYIKHYSLWLDLIIVARTVLTVLTANGAK